jgi:hypothetical protein
MSFVFLIFKIFLLKIIDVYLCLKLWRNYFGFVNERNKRRYNIDLLNANGIRKWNL